MSERKLDIFRVLKHADTKDINFYSNLTDAEKKEFQPFLVSRWLSGTSSARQVFFINELINPFLFVNHIQRDHKSLLWMLMTLATSGKSQRYVWNKLPGKASASKPISTKLVAEKFGYSLKEAVEALECLTGNDVLDLAEEAGVQPEELAKIRKEYKDEQLRADGIGSTTKGRGKTKSKEKTKDFFDF